MVECDLQSLENVLRDFTAVTGLGADVLRSDFTLILQQYGREWRARCPLMREKGVCGVQLRSMLKMCGKNRTPGRYICPAGLVTLIVPMVQLDAVVGYILLGPLRPAVPCVEVCPESAAENAKTTQRYCTELPLYDADKEKSLLCVADMLAKYIQQEGILVLNFGRNMERVIDFINHNLDQPLSLQTIVDHTHISKSVLYKLTHEYFHCTIGELVARKKTEEAVRMLLGTDRPVEEIARILAFSSPSYFGRVFKRLYGVTPHQYRRQNRKE